MRTDKSSLVIIGTKSAIVSLISLSILHDTYQIKTEQSVREYDGQVAGIKVYKLLLSEEFFLSCSDQTPSLKLIHSSVYLHR